MENLCETEKLYNHSFAKAYRIAKSICFNKQLAEDAVSEALVRVLKLEQRGLLKPEAEGLFLTITANEAKRILKKYPFELEYREYFELRYGADIDQLEVALDLFEKIAKLPKNLSEPLKLHYYGGFTYEEISVIMRISLDAVKKRVCRCRMKLKQLYNLNGIEEE